MASKTKKVWTNNVIEDLIEMVEARSVIWNIKSKEYCDRDKRRDTVHVHCYKRRKISFS